MEEVFQIPAAKSIWITFVKHTWWRAGPCKVVYRKGRLLLLLGHGSLPSTTGRSKSLAIIYCISYDAWAGPGSVLSAWDDSPVVLWHFPTQNTPSKPDLIEICPNTSQKISVKNHLIISPHDLFQRWASCAFRKLFLPHLLNFQYKIVTLDPLSSQPEEEFIFFLFEGSFEMFGGLLLCFPLVFPSSD